MQIKTNYSLTALNTFHVPAKADYFAAVSTIDELREISSTSEFTNEERLILGGGSNVLFTSDFHGIIIHPRFSGFEKVDEDSTSICVRVGSGEVWDDFVEYAVKNDLGGIENLSLIPGNVGASPIQNIGAYGVEVRDVIVHVDGFHLQTQSPAQYSTENCGFGYRTSIFKQEFKNEFLVSSVTYRLHKAPHTLTTNYGDVEERLQKYSDYSISAMREVISSIRLTKLPDPAKIGNAGSFFKNPVIQADLASDLKNRYPQLPIYPAENAKMKLSAAWLIDQAKCKGIRRGNAGSYNMQPLVLVNHGKSTGKEIEDLAAFISEAVETKFGIRLEPEVNII